MSNISACVPQGRIVQGFLNDRSHWNENVASEKGISLTQQHWKIIHILRTEFYANSGILPSERDVQRGYTREWDALLTDAELNTLFPLGLKSQAAKIAGCLTINSVSDLLLVKGDAVWSIKPDQPVIDALKILSDKNIGALMVVEDGNLVGVMSERDITRDLLLQDKMIGDVKVADIMSRDVVSVAPNTSLDDCMGLMTDCGIRHLPVLSQERLVGVLSMPDLVKVVVEQQHFVITHLKSQQEIPAVLN